MSNIVLGREEVYKASSQVWSFRNVDDIVNGINLRFSNLAGGFPFESSGHRFTSSECLYLCGEWSDNTEEHRMIQDFLMQMASGYACNRYGKAIFRKQVREDFPTLGTPTTIIRNGVDFRLAVMAVCADAPSADAPMLSAALFSASTRLRCASSNMRNSFLIPSPLIQFSSRTLVLSVESASIHRLFSAGSARSG